MVYVCFDFTPTEDIAAWEGFIQLLTGIRAHEHPNHYAIPCVGNNLYAFITGSKIENSSTLKYGTTYRFSGSWITAD